MTVSLDKRLKENIKGYSLANLFDLEKVSSYFTHLQEALGVELLLTERHGETAVAAGDFEGFVPDVVNEPGRKVRVQNRTIGHIYAKVPAGEKEELLNQLLDEMTDIYANMAEKHYLYRETATYADELKQKMNDDEYKLDHNEHLDALTGYLNKTYFELRIKKMEEAGVAPAAIVCANINDWKFANDHYGDEESDRLIKIIADVIRGEAKDGYVLGRVDGDVFEIIIPNPEEGEAEDFCKRIQEKCQTYEDSILAPSIAVGLVYRISVEEPFKERYSDAEYEMFQNKLEMKHTYGYQERLVKGIMR